MIDHTWHDQARNRDVPVRVFVPKGEERAGGASAEKFPVVVFSHGAGGSREGYAYVGKHLASHGYLVVLPQHAGSDTPAMRSLVGGDDPESHEALREKARESIRARVREKLAGGGDGKSVKEGVQEDLSRAFNDGLGGPVSKMVNDPANLENRPRDVSFVLDQVAREPELAARADLSRVGVAGHSFGAYTSLAAAGMRVKVEGVSRAWPDARVKAAVAMSPQGRGVMGIDDGSWDEVRVPVLCLTGTKDMGQGQRAAAWRRDILGHIKAPTTFIEIADANHMTFAMSKEGLSDSQRLRGGVYNEEHNRLIRLSMTAFLDAYVKGEAQARAFVEGEGGGSLKAAVSAEASFERAGTPR